MTHPFATRRGRKLRVVILTRDLWQCRICGTLLREGRHEPRSAVVDHIVPIEIDPGLTFDPGNLWAVCKHDHDTTCASIEARYSTAEEIRRAKLAYRPVGLDGYPIHMQSNCSANAG